MFIIFVYYSILWAPYGQWGYYYHHFLLFLRTPAACLHIEYAQLMLTQLSRAGEVVEKRGVHIRKRRWIWDKKDIGVSKTLFAWFSFFLALILTIQIPKKDKERNWRWEENSMELPSCNFCNVPLGSNYSFSDTSTRCIVSATHFCPMKKWTPPRSRTAPFQLTITLEGRCYQSNWISRKVSLEQW